jgi:nanoRNase/pAp phosphatase (c-di-AMP/oligoRNAs hydrolase)
MDLPIKELNKVLDSATNVLITGPSNPNLDVLGTAMAWQIFLSRQKKKVELCFDGKLPKYSFLPQHIKSLQNLGNLNKFKIILDTSKTKVKQLSYDMEGDELIIDLVPDNGVFSSQDVSTDRGEYKYDLIIVLGADTLDSLGSVFSENRHFFHSRPIVNIDTSVINVNYGQINIVESSSTSLAEISYSILEKNINQEIATCLLSGMIMATNSFQSPKVTPDSLSLASQLIVKGAEREKIIEGIYRTKDIQTLKSWGKVLSRLKKQNNIISSYLNHDELDNLPKDFAEMVKDLILSTPGAQVAVIFYQLELQQTEAWVYSISNINATDLIKDLGATGSRHLAKVIVDKDIDLATTSIVSTITKKLDIINGA